MHYVFSSSFQNDVACCERSEDFHFVIHGDSELHRDLLQGALVNTIYKRPLGGAHDG
jgi:hypothetical protein